MAIAFDAFGDLLSTTGTSLSGTHVVTGSNPYLFVLTVGNITTDLITGVTYNTVAMTRLNGVLCPADRYATLWGLANPATGSHSVAITASSSIFIAGVSASYTGVGSVETTAVNTATSPATSVTGTVVTTAANCWTVAGFRNDNAVALAGTGTTSRGSGGDTAESMMDSNGVLAAGSHTLQATLAGGENWAVIIASLAPFVVGATIIDENEWNALEPQTNPLLISRW